MTASIRVEWRKLRRSRVVQVATALMGLLLPAMGLGFYSVAVNGGTGALAGKAAALLTGEGWVGYLGFVDQIAAVALFLGAGVVVAWVFGREHADRTFPALFALPVSRGAIAGAKLVVSTVWVAALTLLVGLVALVLGLATGVGPVDAALTTEVLRLLGIGITAGMLALTMGLVASIGRGYLPAIGAMSLIIAAAQVAVLFGTGGWFPFAIPGLLAIAGSEGAPELSAVQVALIPALTVAGAWATIVWWCRAEVV